MEKLDPPLNKDYGPLIMWASDLADLLSDLKDCTDIEFVADNVKYESIEEFIKESKGRNPSKVMIKALNPYLKVELYEHSASLYVSSSQLLPSGLFYKIDSILNRCERKPKIFYRQSWTIGSSIVPVILFNVTRLKPYFYHFTWIYGLAFSWMIYVAFIVTMRHSIVQPIHKEERPSFISRNIDSIIIAVIAALIGAVIGAVATKMVDKAWENYSSTAAEKAAPIAPP